MQPEITESEVGTSDSYEVMELAMAEKLERERIARLKEYLNGGDEDEQV